MGRRAGLTLESISSAACTLADRDGFESLTLSGVAEALGVRTPSLYHHVDGLDGLRRTVVQRGFAELCRYADAARGARVGRAAFVAQCHAYRAFAHDHPGLYTALNTADLAPDNTELWTAMLTAITPVMASLQELGLGDQVWEALRLYRASMHGFLSFELHDAFGFELDIDHSFDTLIEVLLTGLLAQVAPGD